MVKRSAHFTCPHWRRCRSEARRCFASASASLLALSRRILRVGASCGTPLMVPSVMRPLPPRSVNGICWSINRQEAGPRAASHTSAGDRSPALTAS